MMTGNSMKGDSDPGIDLLADAHSRERRLQAQLDDTWQELQYLRASLKVLVADAVTLFDDNDDSDIYVAADDIDLLLKSACKQPKPLTTQEYIDSERTRRAQEYEPPAITETVRYEPLPDENDPGCETAFVVEYTDCTLELTLLGPNDTCGSCDEAALRHKGYPRPGHNNYNPHLHATKEIEDDRPK